MQSDASEGVRTTRSASRSGTHHPNDHAQDTAASDVNGGYAKKHIVRRCGPREAAIQVTDL